MTSSGIIGTSEEAHKDVNWTFTMPNTIQTTPVFLAKVFAKPLDNVLDAMESLIQ